MGTLGHAKRWVKYSGTHAYRLIPTPASFCGSVLPTAFQ